MKKLLFATTDYQYLAQKVLDLWSFKKGEVETRFFTDGERYQRIISEVANREVILIGGTIHEAATLELFDLASALVSYGADSLSMVVPYYGYSTMERAVKSREIVTAKTRARLFSAIPQIHKGNRIYLFDLHTEGIPHYFEQNLHPTHVYCKPIVIDACRQYGGSDFVLASTDAGRAKWVESLANDMSVGAAFILKRRIRDGHTEISAVNADVRGKIVIIYDDMIRSGSSIINAAKTYHAEGAEKIYLITSHGLFVGDGLDKIKASGIIEKVICTDSHANVESIQDDFLEVRSIAPLINTQIGDQ